MAKSNKYYKYGVFEIHVNTGSKETIIAKFTKEQYADFFKERIEQHENQMNSLFSYKVKKL